MIAMHGERGRVWCDSMPTHIAALADQWHLVVDEPFPLSFNYVCRAHRRVDGLPVVIKTSLHREFAGEVQMLRHYAGQGAVPLLAVDEVRQAILLPYITPGTTLYNAIPDNDDLATTIAAQVMQASIRPHTTTLTLPTCTDWGAALQRIKPTLGASCAPFAPQHVEWAIDIYATLGNDGPHYALHGDFHHYNILQHHDEWLVIDPQGVVACKAYECGAYLRNPVERLVASGEVENITRRRIAIMSEVLGVSVHHIALWNFAQMVLSAWWYYEDEQHISADELVLIEPFYRVAKAPH
jgi:streptomycin 6-kinase